ncbi:hypothetical protein V7068_19090 [Bacillus sp. JJ634]
MKHRFIFKVEKWEHSFGTEVDRKLTQLVRSMRLDATGFTHREELASRCGGCKVDPSIGEWVANKKEIKKEELISVLDVHSEIEEVLNEGWPHSSLCIHVYKCCYCGYQKIKVYEESF